MSNTHTISAPVFNIQSYCIHDGPGIRSTVFVKGCPLKCVWCHNPESNSAKPELMIYSSKCTGCGQCVEHCPLGLISIKFSDLHSKMLSETDRAKCVACGKCADFCPNSARDISGKVRTAQDVFEEVRKDKMFYDSSNGGITISGGEILLYPEFCSEVMGLCRQDGIHTALESCMFADRGKIKKAVENADLALCDIKHMDSKKHKELTGVENEIILENIKYVHNELGVPVIIRTPLVPGMNSSDENIEATSKFIAKNLGYDVQYHLLPYHKLGESKLDSLGRPASLGIEAPDEDLKQRALEIASKYLKNVQIGG